MNNKIFLLIAIIILGTIFGGFVFAEQLTERQLTVTNGQGNFRASGLSRGQQFTIGVSGINETVNATKIELNLSKSPGSTGLLNVSIYTLNLTGIINESSSIIANGTINYDFINETLDNSTVINISMISYGLLEPGIKYAFAPDITGNLEMVTSFAGSDTYSGGGILRNNGAGWFIESSNDLYFKIFADALSATNINVILNTPEDDSVTTEDNQEFNATISPTNLNITNATFFLWFLNGSLINQTTINAYGNNTPNETSLLLENIPFGYMNWNVKACGENSTNVICEFSTSNYTIIRQQFSVDSISFDNEVYETDLETFILNISTTDDVLSVDSNLYYNNKSYRSDTECESGTCIITNNIDIPTINNSIAQNMSFFYELSIYDGTSRLRYNTTEYHQNISKIFLEECGGTYTVKALNFTSYDERNLTRINPFYIAGTFDMWLGNGGTMRTNSFQKLSTSNLSLCISPPELSYKINSDIDYSFSDENITFTSRNYYFRNATINNITQDIPLYLLQSDYRTSFIIYVIDITQNAIEDALIYVQRYYPSDGEYRTVQISRTNNDGKTIGFYEVETVEYRHIVIKNGQVLKLTEKGKIFPESAPFTITLTIGEDITSPWEVFEGIPNVLSNLSYNKDTQIVTYTWIDTTGTLSMANLTVERARTNESNIIACSKFSVLQAGTLTCNLTGETGTLIARGYIGRSPSVLDKLITITISSIRDIIARPFLILWILFLIASIAMSFLFPPAGIPITIVIFIAGYLLGITSIGWIFIWAIIATGIWILIETST